MRKLLPLFLIIAAGWVLGCSKKMSEAQLYAEVQKFETQEEVEMLVNIYQELLDRFPKSEKADQVLYKLALIYQNNKHDFANAIACHERLMKEYPQSRYVSQSHFMAGFIYANEIKDLEKARDAYNSFLGAYPQHELVPSVRWELEHLGQDISAIDIFAKANPEQQKAPAAATAGAAKKSAKP